jgi:hypothetical protein
MRLTKRDAVATVLVAVAVVAYGLWLGDVALTGVSTRAIAAVVLGLGLLGCTSNQRGMADMYGVGDRRGASMPYIVAASSLGALALVAGVIAVVARSESMLAALVIAMVTLWALSTGRHATTRVGTAVTEPTARPLHKAA